MNRREFIASLGATAIGEGGASSQPWPTRRSALPVSSGSAYDLIVAGGGPAGIAAAVTAGRQGLRVALLESQGALGGVWTSGLLSCLLGFNQSPMDREFVARLRRWEAVSPRKPNTQTAWIYEPEYMKRVCEDLCDEAGVGFVFNSPVVAAEREGRRLVAAVTESKSGRMAWRARYFVDCTGDGDLAALAGCGFSVGGGEGDAEQPASLIALVMLPGKVPVSCIANDDSNFVPVEQDAKAAFRRELERVGVTPSYGAPTLFRLRDSLYALMANHEYGVKVDDAAAITRATVRARREVIDMVDALAKKGGEPWRGARVVMTAPQLAHRRARRIHGRYTLALEDLLAGRKFEDGIASCDFCIDVHAVSRAMNAKTPFAVPSGCRVKPYQIPLRACMAADVDNLYMAGRCISGEFLPQASYRITGAAVGMGAGVAAAIAERIKKDGA